MSLFGSNYKFHTGYALSGGGAKGFAHLGALNVLESKGLKPQIIAGTSAGALAGVFYADGFHPDEIADLFTGKEFREFIGFSMPKQGFFKTSGLFHFLKQNLRAKTFEELQIPFISVVTDWKRARTVSFYQGNQLIESVIASCSIPVFFQPQYIDGIPYVDGGLFKNLPVSVIRDQCKYVIAINVSSLMPYCEDAGIKKMVERTFNLMSNSNTLIDKKLCDILIEMEGLDKFTIFDINNLKEIKKIGYETASLKMNESKSKHIIHRCLRHKELESKINRWINQTSSS